MLTLMLLCLAQPDWSKNAPATDYHTLAARALRERKPIVVWVNVSPPLGKMMTDVIHCHVASFPEAESPAVVVGVPSADGKKLWRFDLPAVANAEQIRRVIDNAQQQLRKWHPYERVPQAGDGQC